MPMNGKITAEQMLQETILEREKYETEQLRNMNEDGLTGRMEDDPKIDKSSELLSKYRMHRIIVKLLQILYNIVSASAKIDREECCV